MNRHFEDAQYYLKRAGQTAKRGIEKELEPIERRVRELTGQEKDPEPSRLEEIRADLTDIERRAEGEAREAIENARRRLQSSSEWEEPTERT